VLLGDLSVETSTDTDYDDYSMCPPSPCDVEFENANIVIDGKSSIRQKAKDSSVSIHYINPEMHQELTSIRTTTDNKIQAKITKKTET